MDGQDHINPDALQGLRALVAALRGEGGCPWDRKQTPDSMRVYLIEEMYELLDALDAGEAGPVCEELGDVLFQVFFMARMFEEKQAFDIQDVAEGIVRKMTGRHPHVFGDARAETAEDVRRQWHKFKANEPGRKQEAGPFDSVPKSLPALMRAFRVVERAGRVGLDTEQGRPLSLRWEALEKALADGGAEDTEKALGDFLFALAHASREKGVHPENALNRAIERFTDP